jgi:dihydrofolate synthase/folylpolyglutamate synthase
LQRLGRPERHFDAIHIGGTNGKGSVAVLVYEALLAAGIRAALYTSPHLVDVRERMVVDGRAITPEAFAAWTAQLQHDVEHSGASFFEATTAIAFADFAARGAEVAVIEVGLGGRLDSTNVVTPVVSAVTNVGQDHAEYLGESLEGIAREKAGIAKADTPFVVGEADAALAAVLRRTAEEAGARVVMLPADATYAGPLALRGAHQRRNAALAEAVLAALPEGLRVPPRAVRRGFAAARLPGRFDCRGKWIFDVAHNTEGTATLLDALAQMGPPRPVHALVGILRDKEWPQMLRQVAARVDRLWATVPPSAPPERAWDLAAVRRAAPAAIVEADFEQALADVQRGAATVVVTGSFHTVGDAVARLPGFAPLR